MSIFCLTKSSPRGTCWKIYFDDEFESELDANRELYEIYLEELDNYYGEIENGTEDIHEPTYDEDNGVLTVRRDTDTYSYHITKCD